MEKEIVRDAKIKSLSYGINSINVNIDGIDYGKYIHESDVPMTAEDIKEIILQFLYESSLTVTKFTLDELEEYINKLHIKKEAE